MKCLSCFNEKTIRKIGHPEGGSYTVCQVCGVCERITAKPLIQFSVMLSRWEADEIDRLKSDGKRLSQLMRKHPEILPSKLMLF